MAFPRTLSDVRFPRHNYKCGPWRDGNGNDYIIALDTTLIDEIEVHKADDGDAIWVEVDGSNHPNLGADVISMAGVLDGTKIKIITQDRDGEMEYHDFATSDDGSPDAWGTTAELIETGIDVLGTNHIFCSLGMRADGDRVAVYSGTRANIKGTKFTRVVHNLWEGTSWAGPVAVDDGGSINFRAPNVVMGASDLAHIYFKDDESDDILHKSLNSSNTLSSVEIVNDTTTTPIIMAIAPGVHYNNGSVDRATIGWVDDSGSDLYTSEIDDDGTPGAEEQVSTDDIKIVNSQHKICFLAVDPATNTVYAVYVKDEVTDDDIFYRSNIDGAGWGSSTEVVDGIICTELSVNIYVNDNDDTVLAVLYQESSITVKYTEHVIVAGGGGTTFDQANTGVLSFASGTLTRKIEKVLTGILSFDGTLNFKGFLPLAGVLSFVGDLTKKTFPDSFTSVLDFVSGLLTIKTLKDLTGSISFAGIFGPVTIKKSIGGILSFAGVIDPRRIFLVGLTGVLNFGGDLSKKISPDSFLGSLSFGGALTSILKFTKAITGVLSFAGGLRKKILKDLTGTLSFVGALDKISIFITSLTGVLSFVGDLTKKPNISLAGVLNFASGILTIKTLKDLTGSLSFSGAMTPVKTFIIGLAGVLNFDGVLTIKTLKNLAGSLSFAGALTSVLSFTKAISGSLSFAGDLTIKTLKDLTGSLSFEGTFGPVKIFKDLTGTLSFAGTLTAIRNFFRSFTGSLNFSGDINIKTMKDLVGSLSFSGGLTRKISTAFSSILSFGGILNIKTLKGLLGSLSFVGVLTLTKTFVRAIAGTLSFGGILNIKTIKDLIGSLSFSGIVIRKILKDLLGNLSFSGVLASTPIFTKSITGILSFDGAFASNFIRSAIDSITKILTLPARLFSFTVKSRNLTGELDERSTSLELKDRKED